MACIQFRSNALWMPGVPQHHTEVAGLSVLGAAGQLAHVNGWLELVAAVMRLCPCPSLVARQRSCTALKGRSVCERRGEPTSAGRRALGVGGNITACLATTLHALRSSPLLRGQPCSNTVSTRAKWQACLLREGSPPCV